MTTAAPAGELRFAEPERREAELLLRVGLPCGAVAELTRLGKERGLKLQEYVTALLDTVAEESAARRAPVAEGKRRSWSAAKHPGALTEGPRREERRQRFIAARKRLGITQRQAAEVLGAGPGTVASWETGRVPMPRNMLAQMVELAGQIDETGI